MDRITEREPHCVNVVMSRTTGGHVERMRSNVIAE